jgi:serine/alanine adding enzyme
MAARPYVEKNEVPWNDYVRQSATSSAYHDFGWKRVVERSFGHRTHYLVSEDEESRQIDGILPLVHLKSLLFGNFFVSMPYFNYGGICAENERARHELLDEAVSIARREGATHIELRDAAPVDLGLPVKTDKVSMRLELPEDPDDLWQAFPPKLRSQIRRPQKEDMVARVGREDELESFYRVFARNMRDLGTPVYSKSFFRNILKEFPESARICSVYLGDEAVASGFLVGFRDVLEIPWASSVRNYNRFGPNMLLYWTALEFGCQNGYRIFDFGRSTPNGGTFRFKKQWGSEPTPLYWYYWLSKDGALPELNPHNSKYAAVIKLWKKLPVPITRLIGPGIVKNLP